MRRVKHNGYVVYDGPSLFTGERIVVIITGLLRPSNNRKTGPMAQVFILMADEHPQEALWARREGGICGGCRLRPQPTTAGKGMKRKCYVNIGRQGVGTVWTAFQRGRYPVATDITAIGRRQVIRVGAYGDPAAVPLRIWVALLSESLGWTGYTHGWRRAGALSQWFQASVDTETEYEAARAAGWGTYRIVDDVTTPLKIGEVFCPATEEGGSTELCRTCLQCDGSAQIAVVAHGVGKQHFARTLPVIEHVG